MRAFNEEKEEGKKAENLLMVFYVCLTFTQFKIDSMVTCIHIPYEKINYNFFSPCFRFVVCDTFSCSV